MMRKKNSKGTRVVSYGSVTTARSNNKEPAGPNNHAEPEKDKFFGRSGSGRKALSKIAARINFSMTGKGKESKANKTPKSVGIGKAKKTPEIPNSVETSIDQEPEIEKDNSLSVQQHDGKSIDNTPSVEQIKQLETGSEEPLADNSLSFQQYHGTKDESKTDKPENGNERPSQTNLLQLQSGTNEKCMACDKTVYLVEKVTADNRAYHKSCFRCNHCNRTLKLGNFNSFEGVLYCRPHFDQLFKQTGSLDKSFQGKPKVPKEKTAESESPTANKLSTVFARTTERCVICNNTVYPTEKITVNGTPHHRSCFKCSKGGCTISLSNYIAFEGRLYCKHHHIQLIKEKGNLSQLEADNGMDQDKETDTAKDDHAPS